MSDINSDGSGGGSFEDTDNDGVAELQDNHADFGGGDARNVGSLSPAEIGSGPIIHLSAVADLQTAINDASGGTVKIDETVQEEGINIGESDDGLTLIWVGDNWVEQPADDQDGVSIFNINSSDPPSDCDITMMRPRIRNPNLADADIGNEGSLTQGDSTDAIAVSDVRRLTIMQPEIHHLNGFGLKGAKVHENLTVVGGEIFQTGWDGLYAGGTSGETDDNVVRFDGIKTRNNGRHGVAIAGDPVEGNVHISGLIDSPYAAGVDLEDAGPTDLNVTVLNPSTGGGTGFIDSGCKFSASSRSLSGRIRVENPNNTGFAGKSGQFEDLHIEVRGTPPDKSAAFLKSAPQGSVSLRVVGGGKNAGAIRFLDTKESVPGGLSAKAVVQNAHGASVRWRNMAGSSLDLVSRDPVQAGSSNVDADEATHLMVAGNSGNNAIARFNDIRVVAVDNDGNADHAITVGASNSDENKNRYHGNVINAYSDTPTDGIGSSSDISDLLS